MLYRRVLLIALVFGFSSLLSTATPAPQRPAVPEEDDVIARENWFYGTRAYPNRKTPPGARARALRQGSLLRQKWFAQARSAAQHHLFIASPPGSASTWSQVGPEPGHDPDNTASPSSGRATALAVDPTNPSVVYMGTAGGGVWKTTDGGARWTPLTDSQDSLAIGAIALDPSQPSTVYAGTGEGNSSGDSYYGDGLLKSTDGGATWTRIAGPFAPSGIPGTSFADIAVNPADGSVLLAATLNGVYRSADAGMTWTSVLSGAAAYSVLFDLSGSARAYAALGSLYGSSNNGVYLSTDSGNTWQPLPGSGNNVLPTKNVGRVHLVQSPSSPTKLYVSIANAFGQSGAAGIYVSTDAGTNWTPLTKPASCCFWYTNALAVQPTNSNVLFAGDVDLYQSLDGGSTWNNVRLGAIHVDQHVLAFSHDGSIMYVGNDGGAYSTADPAASSVSWNDLNSTIATITFYPGLSIDAQNLNNALAGSQDNGTQHYSGALAWSWVQCGDGGFNAIDFQNDANLYIACGAGQGLWKSLDGGQSYQSSQSGINTNDRVSFVPPLAMDPSNPAVLYWGSYRLYQTTDGANSWTAISSDLTKGSSQLATIGVAPGDSNTVYTGASDGSVHVSTNALASTSATWTDITGPLPNRGVTQIVVDPASAKQAYASLSGFGGGHVFATADGGNTWQDISGDLPDAPVNSLVIDPDLLLTLYAGTDVGVFATSDGGATWVSLGSGLPNVVVNSLALHVSTRTLRAATHGRSALDLPVPIPSAPLTISSSTLTFPGQVLSTTAAAQTVKLTNLLRAAPLPVSLAATGDFAQTNNCGSAIPPASSCSVAVSFTPLATGARSGQVTVTLTASGATESVGLSGIGIITVNLTPSANAVIAGKAVTLTWATQSQAACTASGGSAGDGWSGGKPSSGSATVTEAAAGTFTYTLACISGAQTAQSQVSITDVAPLTVQLTASASSVNAGQPATLTWASQTGATCTAGGGHTGDGWSGSEPSAGNATVTESSTGTFTYTLACVSTGPAGSQTAQAQVAITDNPAPKGGGGATDPITLIVLLILIGLHFTALRARSAGPPRASKLKRGFWGPMGPLIRLRSWTRSALLLGCLAGAALPVSGDPPSPPRVLCQPCGETGPPKGYVCAGAIMVRSDVETREIPGLQAMCRKQQRDRNGSDER
jgi:photosystem II stability/assembly factor-like uncharacterized protein